MPKRKPISKKARFDIFKRDAFTCQYCGGKPPAVVLEVDHITPVVGGGTNDEYNLITACFDCNRGKGKEGLDITPINVDEHRAIVEEKQQQVKALNAVLRAEKRRTTNSIKKISSIYSEIFEGWELTKSAKISIGRFLKKLPELEVIDAMEIACSKMDKDRCFKYFCGVCWCKIKGDNG